MYTVETVELLVWHMREQVPRVSHSITDGCLALHLTNAVYVCRRQKKATGRREWGSEEELSPKMTLKAGSFPFI